MLRRRVVGRAVVRTAVVGGTAYAVGHHMATKSAEQQYTDQQQNAQIEDDVSASTGILNSTYFSC